MARSSHISIAGSGDRLLAAGVRTHRNSLSVRAPGHIERSDPGWWTCDRREPSVPDAATEGTAGLFCARVRDLANHGNWCGRWLWFSCLDVADRERSARSAGRVSRMARTSTVSRRAFLTGIPRSSGRRQTPAGAAEVHIAAISDDCLARAGVFCMSCRDACAEQAIRFRPRVGGLFLPEVIESACSGCGACIALCPTRAITLADRCGEANDA